MAKSILDIVIKLSKQGGADKETIKGLVQVKSALLESAAVAGTFVAAGYTIKKVLDETVGTMVSYADQVRRIQDATGATAEDSSKLIQILDDQKVSYEQLEKVVAKNGKTYDFTTEGLARMSDEFLQLTDTQEQAKFMNDRFGKQWISFVPVMKQGGAAIRDAADAVSDSLVLTQQGVDQARAYEIAMDDWSDAVMALKVSIGSGLLPTVTKMVQGLAHTSEIREEANRLMQEGVAHNREEALAMAATKVQQDLLAEAMQNGAGAIDGNTESAEENAAALKEISKAHQDMLGLIGKVASAEQSYEESAKSLTAERITIEQERAAAIQEGWWEGSDKIKDFDAALAENATKVEENAAKHHEAMGKIQYDLFITRISVDGITDAEMIMAEQAGLMFGVFDQKSVDTAANMNLVADAVTNGTLKVQDMQKALELLSKGYSVDVVMNIIQRNSGSLGTFNTGHDAKSPTGGGYAEGGITTGLSSGHWEFLHGTEGVFTEDQMAHLAPVGSSGGNSSMAGGGNIYVSLTISSPLTILDEQKAQNMLLPFIVSGIRQAKAQGAIK